MPVFIKINFSGDNSEGFVNIHDITAIFEDVDNDCGVITMNTGASYKIKQKPDEIIDLITRAYENSRHYFWNEGDMTNKN